MLLFLQFAIYHSVNIFSCILTSQAVIIRTWREESVFHAIDDEILKKLKHLAVDEDASLGDLLEESIQDLLKTYEKKQKK